MYHFDEASPTEIVHSESLNDMFKYQSKTYTKQTFWYNHPVKIICIEGLDCSGKETISKELKKIIEENRKHITMIVDFPDYNTNDIVNTMLSADYSMTCNINELFKHDHVKISIKEKVRFFILNILNKLIRTNQIVCDNLIQDFSRIESQEPIYLIFDRYWFCNLWYQYIENDNGYVAQTIQHLVHRYHLPAVDYLFLIDMPWDAIKFFLSKKKKKDINELNIDYLKNVYDQYNKKSITESISTTSPKTEIRRIPVISKGYIDKKYSDNGGLIIENCLQLKTPKEIAKEIYDIVFKEMRLIGEEGPLTFMDKTTIPVNFVDKLLTLNEDINLNCSSDKK